MTVTMTSIRLDTELADEAVKILGVSSRTEAVHVALREIVALKRFKDLMSKYMPRQPPAQTTPAESLVS